MKHAYMTVREVYSGLGNMHETCHMKQSREGCGEVTYMKHAYRGSRGRYWVR